MAFRRTVFFSGRIESAFIRVHQWLEFVLISVVRGLALWLRLCQALPALPRWVHLRLKCGSTLERQLNFRQMVGLNL